MNGPREPDAGLDPTGADARPRPPAPAKPLSQLAKPLSELAEPLSQLAEPARQDADFDRLKRLLLSPESEKLAQIETRLLALDARLGSPERLEKATAEILVEALREAEVARHRELANALAPLVVAAIRNEIANSRDMMVEALYPITGRLVSAAVANAFRDLVADLNARIEKILSTRHWRLRLKALATGKSVSEVALAEARRPILRRALALERGSGRLIAAWPAGDDAGASELVSGLIAAITEFASDVYGETGGELRTLDLGRSRVLLRASPSHLFAAEVEGVLNPQDERAFEAAVWEFWSRIDRDEAQAGPALEQTAPRLFAEPEASAPARRWPLALALAGLAALVLWAGWGPARRAMREGELRALFAQEAAKAPLAAWPLRFSADAREKVLRLSGLAPDAAALAALRGALAAQAPDWRLDESVAFVEGADKAAAGALAARRAREALGERQDLAEARLAGEADALRRANEALSAQLAAQAPDARDRAARLFARTAIFFSRDESLVDPDKARERAREAAGFIKSGDLRVRIVGHADTTGSRGRNIELARARAAAVARMLEENGVAPERIETVARADMQPLSDAAAPRRRDRRVTFELAYEDEPGLAPEPAGEPQTTPAPAERAAP